MKVGQRGGGMEEAGEANTKEKAADWRAVSQSTLISPVAPWPSRRLRASCWLAVLQVPRVGQ